MLLQHLPSLLLVRLSVLEREPTRPLVRTRLPADPAIAACEQNAPERNRSKETGAQGTEAEGQDTGLGPHGVAVEGVDGVKDGGYGERGQRVGGFGVGCGGRYAWEGQYEVGGISGGWVDVPSDKRLLSGTEPVSRTVNAPRVRSVKPRVREK